MRAMSFLFLFIPASPANGARARMSQVRKEGRVFTSANGNKAVIESEKLSIDCARSKLGVACSITTRYQLLIKSPGAEPFAGALLPYSEANVFGIKRKGIDITAQLTAEEKVQTRSATGALSANDDPLVQTGFRSAVSSGSSELVFMTQTDIRCWGYQGYAWPAMHVRHIVGYDDRRQCDAFRFPVFPLKMWGGEPKTDIEIFVIISFQ